MCTRAARLVGGIAFALVFSLSGAQAHASPIVSFQLQGVTPGSCMVSNTTQGGCVRIETSTTWPESTFTVDYDLASIVGDTVPFQMTGLFIPSLGGGFLPLDTFEITSSTVDGTFDTATGFVDIFFDLEVSRNGLRAPEFTYSMTTGNNPTAECGSTAIIPSFFGSNHNSATNELSIVGNLCVDFDPSVLTTDFHNVQMSLTGTMPAPVVAAVPEPGALTLFGVGGLVAGSAVRRSRKLA